MQAQKLQLSSCCLGNFFEHYDTALFSFLAPILAPLIFPNTDILSALIYTYAMIPFGMLARPLGAILFGYVGDRFGRRDALFLSLGGMSIISLLIAFCPLYLKIGVFAPILFCFARVLQNLFAAGEVMGGALFLLENSHKKNHDFLSSIYGMSTIGGIILASFGVSLITHFEQRDFLWRALYLIGCLTALFGLILRKKIKVKNENSFGSCSIKTLWCHKKSLFLIAMVSGFSYATYSVALILITAIVPLVSNITKQEVASLNSALLVLDFCALPFFGWLSAKFSREKVMIGATVVILVCAFPFFQMLPQISFGKLVFIRVFFVLAGVAFSAPFHAWALEIVPKQSRYLVISFGYAIGSQILGGPTVALSLWIYKKTGVVFFVCAYWIALALITLVLLIGKKVSLVRRDFV